jgi:hypothetical protein
VEDGTGGRRFCLEARLRAWILLMLLALVGWRLVFVMAGGTCAREHVEYLSLIPSRPPPLIFPCCTQVAHSKHINEGLKLSSFDEEGIVGAIESSRGE